MKIDIKYYIVGLLVLVSLYFAPTVIAQLNLPQITTVCENKNGTIYSFDDGFSTKLECEGELRRRVVLIGQEGPKGDQGEQGPKGDTGEPPEGVQYIYDVDQVRGAGLDIPAPTTNTKVPGEVTVSCPEACLLWVNYDVDTRNTTITGAPPNGFAHLYHIYVDEVDQAVYNSVNASVPNAAYPLAVNGVFPVSAGDHTVSIYVKVTGGHLQQFTSHLQVMAVSQ